MSENDFLAWNDGYDVGIQEVDEQHRVLASLLNQLHAALRDRHGQPLAREILDRLAEYTRTHFLLEESLMRLSAYPDFEEHRKRHEDLIAQMRELQQDLDGGRTTIGPDLLDFLKKWLIRHISESDRRFSAYFRDGGYARYASLDGEPLPEAGDSKPWWKLW